jgi:hypothetical protein
MLHFGKSQLVGWIVLCSSLSAFLRLQYKHTTLECAPGSETFFMMPILGRLHAYSFSSFDFEKALQQFFSRVDLAFLIWYHALYTLDTLFIIFGAGFPAPLVWKGGGKMSKSTRAQRRYPAYRDGVASRMLKEM